MLYKGWPVHEDVGSFVTIDLILENYRKTIWKLHAHYMKLHETAWNCMKLFSNCLYLKTTWKLHENYLNTAWKLPDNCMKTTWITTWKLHETAWNYSLTAWNCLYTCVCCIRVDLDLKIILIYYLKTECKLPENCRKTTWKLQETAWKYSLLKLPAYLPVWGWICI